MKASLRSNVCGGAISAAKDIHDGLEHPIERSANLLGLAPDSLTVDQYAAELQRSGLKSAPGSEHSIWVEYERFALQRQPCFALHSPSKAELATLFWKLHAPLVDFAVSPSTDKPANSRLYICTNSAYSLEALAKGPRYDVRRGLREFEIRRIDRDQVLRLGFRAFSDTRRRNGLSDCTRKAFTNKFGALQARTHFYAAFKNLNLAAFFGATVVDDWISIGGWSADEFLPLRPNNALVYYLVFQFLILKKYRWVTYGFDSVQPLANAEGLHRFKVKMGFEAVPVHREFVLHPLLRPVVNRHSWRFVSGFWKMSPGNVLLRKAQGALRLACQC